MANPPPPSPPQKHTLLTIPAEIRNSIYKEVFHTSNVIRPNVEQLFYNASVYEKTGSHPSFPPDSRGVSKALALVFTCHQIHDEALRFHYAHNTFSFRDTYDLYRYLYMIGSSRRRCISSLEVMWRGERCREAAELAGECVSLRRLYIGVNGVTTEKTKRPQENLWLARGVGQLRKTRGLTNLDLKVREVLVWGPCCPLPVFEMGIREAYHRAFTDFGWHLKFGATHVEEFERGLREEMCMDKEELDLQEEEAADVEPKETSVVGAENVRQASTPVKKESKQRVLRTGKVAIERRKTRKVHARKARKTGEAERRAPKARFR